MDHGKTTLVDGMLKQTHTFRENEAEMQQIQSLTATILNAKRVSPYLPKTLQLSIKIRKFNIIDTPGHADFSGEVERVINMADGVLIVDAAEGPLPQTAFLYYKSIRTHITVIVVINKLTDLTHNLKKCFEKLKVYFSICLTMKIISISRFICYRERRKGVEHTSSQS